MGSIQLRVPRVRDGSYFPGLIEPPRRAERAFVAVVQETYVQGVSTCQVDELAQTLGLNGISKSQVSLLCQELDAELERFRRRPFGHTSYPSIWLDATFLKGWQQGRVVAQAVAIGLNATTGQREVLGLDVGPSEGSAFWLDFLRSLVARGLSRMELVVSDAHKELKAAIRSVLHRASWQRCRVHFVRNALALVPRFAQQLVAATIRTVFAQPDAQMARTQWRHVADGFRCPLSQTRRTRSSALSVASAWPTGRSNRGASSPCFVPLGEPMVRVSVVTGSAINCAGAAHGRDDSVALARKSNDAGEG